jgi:hypothetical protein
MNLVVEEASGQHPGGNIAECKNEAAYRQVLLADAEVSKVMESLEQFVALVRSSEKPAREESWRRGSDSSNRVPRIFPIVRGRAFKRCP